MRHIKKFSSLIELRSIHTKSVLMESVSILESFNQKTIYRNYKINDNNLRVLITNLENLEDHISDLEDSDFTNSNFNIYMKPSGDGKNDQYFIIGKDLERFHFEIESDKFSDYDFGDRVDYEVLIQANKYNL